MSDVQQTMNRGDAPLTRAAQQRRAAASRSRDVVRSRNRGWLIRRSLMAADVIGLLLAFFLAQSLISDDSGAPDKFRGLSEYALFAASLPAWVLIARQFGLYSRDEEQPAYTTADDVVRVFNMLNAGVWGVFVVTWLTGIVHPSMPKLIVFWTCALLLIPAGRAIARGICRRTETYVQNTVVYGTGRVGQLVAKKLLQHPEYGVRVIGFVDNDPGAEGLTDLHGVPVLGGIERLQELVPELQVERVIFAFPEATRIETIETARMLNGAGVHVDVVPQLFELLDPHVEIHAAEGLTLMGLPPTRWSRSSLLLKRALDVTVASTALVALAPLLAAVAVAIALDSRGPVLFRQTRIGAGGRPFRILKFRTMVADADSRKREFAHLNKHIDADPRMFKISGDPRVTRVGKVLRSYSLDELPQLVNVLRGEMSLVGPRPLIPEEDLHVNGWSRRRLHLKPGMTGLWQVLGRDGIPFEEMVQLDYRYVTYWSLTSDLKLIARTFPLLRRRHDF